MSDIKFSINWNSYSNHLTKGFSSLQQNAEFVDMTLAADGHLVKVHQNIVALGSPYLKAMLQSAACRHPVIFLHNIGSDILTYILEYIYTGEVKVPTNDMDIFVKACKSLCINGLETAIAPMTSPTTEVTSASGRINEPSDKNIAAHITINTQANNNYNFEVIPNHKDIVINSKEIMYSDTPSTISHNNENMNPVLGNIELVDIGSINNVVILEPNTENSPKILSNLEFSRPSQRCDNAKPANFIINADNREKAEQCNLAVNIQEDFHNETNNYEFNTNNFSNIENQETLTKEDTNLETLLMTMSDCQMQEYAGTPNAELLNIANTKDSRQPESGQSNSHTESDRHITQDTFEDLMVSEDEEHKVVRIKSQKILKSLKKIGSHMKMKNQLEKGPTITLNKVDRIKMDKLPHFTISNRGALQLILNRFLYHTHHYSHGGRKRRWRCVDYRKLHCPAYIDTDKEEITAMSQDHLHSNHDSIIRKKIKSNIVFTSLANAVTTVNSYLKDQHSQQDEHSTDTVKKKCRKYINM